MKKEERCAKPDFKPTLEQMELLGWYVQQPGFHAWFKSMLHYFLDYKEYEYKKAIRELTNEQKETVLAELLAYFVQKDEFGVDKLIELGIEPTVFYHWLLYTLAVPGKE